MRKHKGSTLLEILLVLTVSAVLIMVGIRYFTVVDLNRQVAEAISKIDIVSRASYEWLTSERQADFRAIEDDVLTSLGLVSEAEMINPWGGKISVEPGNDLKHVKISLLGIGPAACQGLRRHLLTIATDESSEEQCVTGNYYGDF